MVGAEPGLAAVEEQLREVRAELAGLRGLVEQLLERQIIPQKSADLLSRDDRALLARLSPAIAGALGSTEFLTRDLFGHDSAALRIVLRGLNPRQVGRLLKRAEGKPVDGYVVERVGVELGAILWRVVRVPEFLREQNLAVPPHGPQGQA